MADTALGDLPLLGTLPDDNDLIPLTDVSDTSESAEGTTKNMSKADLFNSPNIFTPSISAPSLTVPVIAGAFGQTTGMTLRGPTNYIGGAIDPAVSDPVNAGGAIALGDAGSNGLVFVVSSSAEMVIVALTGSIHEVTIANAIRGTWGTVSGAPNTYNIFWNGLAYILENLSGATRQFSVTRVGSFLSQ